MGFVFGMTKADIDTYYPQYTYSISADKSAINENEQVTFTINTTGVANGTTLYWEVITVSGTVNSSDFTSAISGSASINSNTATFNLTTSNDVNTEGTESFKVRLYTGSVAGTQVAETSTITISDTSVGPTYSVPGTPKTMNETDYDTCSVTTTNVANGTTLYYQLVGASGTINADDFSTPISGSFTINSNYGSFGIGTNADLTTEGTETFNAIIYTGSVGGTQVAQSPLYTITDTSLSPPSDSNFNRNVLLMNGNETNNANNNTFIDSSVNNYTITRIGNVTQGTRSPFNSDMSWSFNGTTSYLDIPFQPLVINTNYTLEFWMFSTKTNTCIFDNNQYNNNLNFSVLYNSVEYIGIMNKTNSTTYYFTNIKASINTWNHIALVKNSGTLYCYVNGQLAGSTTGMEALSNSAEKWQVGVQYTTTLQKYFKGLINNLRITNSAVYTSTFTPTTTNLSSTADTILLTANQYNIVDQSTNNLTITAIGNPTWDSLVPTNPTSEYSTTVNSGSIYIDGLTDHYLTTTHPLSTFEYSPTVKYTIECWVYMTTLAEKGIIGALGNSYFGLHTNSSSRLAASFSFSSTVTLTDTTNFTTDQWHHVAMVRDGSSLYLFKNGKLVASSTNTTATNLSTGNLVVGTYYNNTYCFPGRISNVRILNGTALYTTNFTPTTTPLTTIANTSLLLSATNAGIKDLTRLNNIETIGNAKISTSQFKHGSSSILFTNKTDALKFYDTNTFTFTGDFTIEAWIYPTTLYAGSWGIIDARTSGATPTAWVFGVANVAGIQRLLYFDGTSYTATSTSITLNQWQHVAMVRSGSTIRFYVNGIPDNYSFTKSETITSGTNPIIGHKDGTQSGYGTQGYIDDLRISKIARYTSNFTPTQLLTH